MPKSPSKAKTDKQRDACNNMRGTIQVWQKLCISMIQIFCQYLQATSPPECDPEILELYRVQQKQAEEENVGGKKTAMLTFLQLSQIFGLIEVLPFQDPADP